MPQGHHIEAVDEKTPLLHQNSSQKANTRDHSASHSRTPTMRVSLEDFLYASESYWAIVKPVSVTMILAALAVVEIETEESKEAAESGLKAYTVYDDDDQNTSNSEKFGESLINALVIVGVLAIATFGIVLLYKFKCMKCLVGYMMFRLVPM